MGDQQGYGVGVGGHGMRRSYRFVGSSPLPTSNPLRTGACSASVAECRMNLVISIGPITLVGIARWKLYLFWLSLSGFGDCFFPLLLLCHFISFHFFFVISISHPSPESEL